MMKSMDDPDTGFILSMWDSEESLDAALGGAIKQIQGSVMDLAIGPPDMKRLEAREVVPLKMTTPA